MSNVTPFDVAHVILEKLADVSAMKLHKLLYYCQAWSLVWDERELFADDFEAWANGPVLPSLYAAHRGQFKMCKGFFPTGDWRKLTQDQLDTIEAVLSHYGAKSAQQLSDLTHQEDPWKNAREGVLPMQPSTNPISKASMEEYYSAL